MESDSNHQPDIIVGGSGGPARNVRVRHTHTPPRPRSIPPLDERLAWLRDEIAKAGRLLPPEDIAALRRRYELWSRASTNVAASDWRKVLGDETLVELVPMKAQGYRGREKTELWLRVKPTPEASSA